MHLFVYYYAFNIFNSEYDVISYSCWNFEISGYKISCQDDKCEPEDI